MKDVSNLRKLNEVCEISNGYAFKSEDFSDSGVPLLRISNIKNEKVIFDDSTAYLSEGFLEKFKNFIVRKGDVVIALSGATTGKYGIYQYHKPCLLNQRIGIIRNESSTVLESKYLYYYLSTLKSEILRKAQGVAQPNISTKDLGKMCIPLPKLAEQKQIAAILDAADSLRQKDQQLVEHYTALSQSLFLEMFGDPITNPMEWSIKPLKDLSKRISSGSTPKGGSNVYVEKGVLFLRSQNVWNNKLELNDIAYIDEQTHQNMKKTSLKNKDILITKTGRFNTENSSLGRAAMFCGDDGTANINGHVYLVRLEEKINNKFVLFLLTTKQYRGYIRRVCVGGIDKRQINKEHLECFPIIEPPLELQNQFAERVAIIEQQKQQAQTNLKKSEALFNSLLQRAFTGELTADKAA